jgi:periplasmic protein TonB
MPRRPSIVLLSVTGHAITLGILAVLSIIAPDALPFPRELLAAPVVRVVQVPEPPSPRTATPPPDRSADPVTPSDSQPVEIAPPVETPDGIAPDTGTLPDNGLRHQISHLESSSRGFPGTGIGPSEDVAPVAPVDRRPIALHSGIEPPRKVFDRAPEYPSLAKAAGIQGLVIVEVIIDEHGDVTNARVLRSTAVLDQAALDAVRRWKFSPARLNGEAIPVVMTVTINFQLTR